jgi:hypothetical protein
VLGLDVDLYEGVGAAAADDLLDQPQRRVRHRERATRQEQLPWLPDRWVQGLWLGSADRDRPDPLPIERARSYLPTLPKGTPCRAVTAALEAALRRLPP